jgi:hypothetical protein
MFSQPIPEETEKERCMETKAAIESDIKNSQFSSYSICSILDNKNYNLSKTNNVSNIKKVKDEIDQIDLIESKTSVMQQNKPKWSLKIQLQSNNVHVSGILYIYF